MPTFLWKKDDRTLDNAAKAMAVILTVVRLPQLLKVPKSPNQDDGVPTKGMRQQAYLVHAKTCHYCYLILQITFIATHRGGKHSVYFVHLRATVPASR